MTRLSMPEQFGALYVCPASGDHNALHAAAHSLLQAALADYAVPVPSAKLYYREDGKPFFTDAPAILLNAFALPVTVASFFILYALPHLFP